MKTLTLSNSEKLTLVDDLDFEFFSNFRWRLLGCYVYCKQLGFMHYAVMQRKDIIVPNDKFVDHRNRNKLDNCRKNLRVATSSENSHNRAMPVSNTGYRGTKKVLNSKGRFEATLWIDNNRIHVGMFETAREAGIARDLMMENYRKDFMIYSVPDASFQEVENIKMQMAKPKNRTKDLSNFIGLQKQKNVWSISLQSNGERIFFGRFLNEKDAAMVRDYISIRLKLNLPLNFPLQPEKSYLDSLSRRVSRNGKYGKYKWITYIKSRNKFTVRFKIDGKLRRFGCFKTDSEAATYANEIIDAMNLGLDKNLMTQNDIVLESIIEIDNLFKSKA